MEARAEQRKKVEKEDGEPLFDMVHGVPGAGKGMLIGWLREAFEEVLGWVHGVQFVCLAFQNAMAALIQGYTIHHWSGIPVNDTDGMGTTRDTHKLSTKCQCLRFILIDEISMVSAQLLGQLELVISKVARRRGLYKLRSDGTSRPFGGVNTLLFGDWWQLKPVSGTALFADPASASGGVTAHGLQLMWGEPPNAVHRCWDFTQSLRCGDQWYNSILSQCRAGNMHVEAYRFLNGFPTASPTSLAKDTSRDPSCTCAGSCDNDGFYIPWVQDFLTRGVPGAELVAKECSVCTMQRARRGRVLDMEALPTQELDHAPFDTAPALYAYNVPRYYTLMQRSRKFARINALRLSWCFAKDLPLQWKIATSHRSRWTRRRDCDSSFTTNKLATSQARSHWHVVFPCASQMPWTASGACSAAGAVSLSAGRHTPWKKALRWMASSSSLSSLSPLTSISQKPLG